MDNFSYIIGADREAAVVDPGWEYKKLILISSDEGLKITKILLTHGHLDHAQEVGKLVRETGAEVYVHKLENFESKDARINFIEDGDVINFCRVKIKVLFTPGHTPGGVCFLVGERLLTGDTLFVGTIGRVDLPGSDKKSMRESLIKLGELDEKIEIWPGHDYGPKVSSTIGYEKTHNSFMKT